MCLDWSSILSSAAGALLAGILALVGIKWGFTGTARINREERKARRLEEKNGLIAALTGELTFLCRSYQYREAAIARADAAERPYFNVPRREETEVYDKLLDRIVLLDAAQTGRVVHAYISAKHLLLNLERLETELNEPPLEGKETPGYIRVRRSNFTAARKLHIDRVVIFDEALKALGDG